MKVIKALEEVQEKKSRQNHGSYISLTSAQKYEFGTQAAEHGVTAMIRYYGKSTQI